MRLDVVERTEPYEKIGSVYVADAHYRSGDAARVFIKQYLPPSVCDGISEMSETVHMPTADVEIMAFAQEHRRWMAVATDKPVEWWRGIRGFRAHDAGEARTEKPE